MIGRRPLDVEALGFRWPSYIGKSGSDYMNEKVSLLLLTRFNVCSLFSSWIQLTYCSLDVKQQPTNQSNCTVLKLVGKYHSRVFTSKRQFQSICYEITVSKAYNPGFKIYM